MPISAGSPHPATPPAIDLSTAKAKFLAAARAVDGMPITAGNGTANRACPEDDLPLQPSFWDNERLPRWARVAFAARCARRVMPLFKKYWPNATKEHLTAVAKAVSVAETAARAAAIDASHTAYPAYPAHAAADAAYAAAHAAAYAAHAATSAAYAAHAYTAHIADAYAVADAAYAADAAWKALVTTATVRTVHTLSAPTRDFARLLLLAKEQNWTDDTPVPPEVFGPMWDGDPPPWWVEDVTAGLEPDPVENQTTTPAAT